MTHYDKLQIELEKSHEQYIRNKFPLRYIQAFYPQSNQVQTDDYIPMFSSISPKECIEADFETTKRCFAQNNKHLKKKLDEYMIQFDEKQQKTMVIAKKQLGTSFELDKSIGFSDFISKEI